MNSDCRKAVRLFQSLVLLFLVAFLFGGQTAITALAQDGPAFATTLSLKEDPVGGPIHVKTGETIYLNGTISRSTNFFLNVDLFLKSNRTEGEDWILLKTEPGRNFTLSDPVRYQFEIKLLEEGSFHFRPWATVTGSPNATLSRPIDADAQACPRCAGLGSLVVVEGPDYTNGTRDQIGTFSSVSVAIYAGIAATAAAGAATAFYLSKRRGLK